MKKLFPILILLMLLLSNVAFAGEETPQTISIGLFYGWTAPETMQISSGDGLVIGETDAGSDITLKTDAGCVVAVSADGTELASVPLAADCAVEKLGWWQIFVELLRLITMS